MGHALSRAGRIHEAIAALDTAIRLSPHDPILWTMEHLRAVAHLEIGDYEKAVADAKLACRHPNTSFWSYLTLASGLSYLGREQEIAEAKSILYKFWPEFSMSEFAKMVPFDPAAWSNWRDGLHQAGFTFPEPTESRD